MNVMKFNVQRIDMDKYGRVVFNVDDFSHLVGQGDLATAKLSDPAPALMFVATRGWTDIVVVETGEVLSYDGAGEYFGWTALLSSAVQQDLFSSPAGASVDGVAFCCDHTQDRVLYRRSLVLTPTSHRAGLRIRSRLSWCWDDNPPASTTITHMQREIFPEGNPQP
jgi:hypothetical protein